MGEIALADGDRSRAATRVPGSFLSIGKKGREAAVQRPALYTAAAILAAVALAHWLRFFLQTEIIVGGFAIPVLWSLPAAIIATLLSAWIFIVGRRS